MFILWDSFFYLYLMMRYIFLISQTIFTIAGQLGFRRLFLMLQHSLRQSIDQLNLLSSISCFPINSRHYAASRLFFPILSLLIISEWCILSIESTREFIILKHRDILKQQSPMIISSLGSFPLSSMQYSKQHFALLNSRISTYQFPTRKYTRNCQFTPKHLSTKQIQFLQMVSVQEENPPALAIEASKDSTVLQFITSCFQSLYVQSSVGSVWLRMLTFSGIAGSLREYKSYFNCCRMPHLRQSFARKHVSKKHYSYWLYLLVLVLYFSINTFEKLLSNYLYMLSEQIIRFFARAINCSSLPFVNSNRSRDLQSFLFSLFSINLFTFSANWISFPLDTDLCSSFFSLLQQNFRVYGELFLESAASSEKVLYSDASTFLILPSHSSLCVAQCFSW